MAVSTKVSVSIKAAEGVSSENVGGVLNHVLELMLTLADSAADVVWSDRRSLSASANEVLRLRGSALTGQLGQGIDIATLKLLYVKNRSSTDGDNLAIGPDATNGLVTGLFNAAADRVVVPAGGAVLWYDPNGITLGSAASDELNVAEVGGANTVSYDIIALGSSS